MFRKTQTQPLPKGAEIVNRRGVRVARWTGKGGTVRTAEVVGDPGAERVRLESLTWYAKLTRADGTREVVNTGCRDKGAAAAWLAAERSKQDKLKAGVLTEAEVTAADAGRRPLAEVAAAFVQTLADKGRTAGHVKETARYLERARLGLGWRTLADMEGDALNGWLAEQGFGACTCNAFLLAHTSMARWARRRGWLAADPFAGLERRNKAADRRHVRRALTVEELERLYDAAERRPLEEALRGNRGRGRAMGKKEAEVSPARRDKLAWLGRTRSMAYRVAAGTGLRWGELRSIRLGACRLADDPPHLVLKAQDEKARRGAQVPVSPTLAAALGEYVAERRARLLGGRDALPGALDGVALFEVPKQVTKVFHADCAAAGIERVDSAGRVVDVHALRHTFGMALARAGVSLQVAMKAMRHSTPVLTARVYSHLTALDVAGAVAKLPETGPRNIAPNIAPDAVAEGQNMAFLGNSTLEVDDRATKDTIRVSANDDRGFQRVASEEGGGRCRTRTCDFLGVNKEESSCKFNDSNTYEGGGGSIAPNIAPDSEIGARDAVAEALKAMPREHLVGLLLEVLGGGAGEGGK